MVDTGDRKRKGVSFVFLLLLGIGLGILFRNVRIGLLIGLALGLLSVRLIKRK